VKKKKKREILHTFIFHKKSKISIYTAKRFSLSSPKDLTYKNWQHLIYMYSKTCLNQIYMETNFWVWNSQAFDLYMLNEQGFPKLGLLDFILCSVYTGFGWYSFHHNFNYLEELYFSVYEGIVDDVISYERAKIKNKIKWWCCFYCLSKHQEQLTNLNFDFQTWLFFFRSCRQLNEYLLAKKLPSYKTIYWTNQ
jgi:hypothetical protein